MKIRLPLAALIVLNSGASFASEFHSPLPEICRKTAKDSVPGIIQLFSADPTLIRNAGARSPSELASLQFDFSNSIRLHDFDYQKLDGAGTFADLLIATNSWSVPLCLGRECLVIGIVECDEAAGKATVVYAGRSLQAWRFKESEQRLKDLGGDHTANAKIVATDTLDFVYVPGNDATKSYLIPTSEDLAASLGQQMGGDIFENGSGPGSVNRIDFVTFKKIVLKRNEIFQASDESESENELPVQAENFPTASKLTQPGQRENEFHSTIVDLNETSSPDPTASEAPDATDGMVDSDSDSEKKITSLTVFLSSGVGIAIAIFLLFFRRKKST